jgi:hypothetical protein
MVTLTFYFPELSMVELDGQILPTSSYTYDNVTGLVTLQVDSGMHHIRLMHSNLKISPQDIVLSSQHYYYGDTLEADIGFDYFGIPSATVNLSVYLDEVAENKLLDKQSFALSGSGRQDYQFSRSTKGILGDHKLVVNLSWDGEDWVITDDLTDMNFTVRGWDYRIPLSQVIKDSVQGLHQPVTVDLDLSAALASLPGAMGSVDVDSIRLVQVDPATDIMIEQDATKSGYLRYEVPSAFTPDPAFQPLSNAVGTLTFSLDGTQGPATSEYHVYFSTEEDMIAYPGPASSGKSVAGVFQTRFDIQQGGYQIPGWVYVLDGEVTFTVSGNSLSKTYYLNLTHYDSGQQFFKTFLGGDTREILIQNMPNGVYNFTLQNGGSRDPYFSLGCDSPILFDKDGVMPSGLLSEPVDGDAVFYFYVPAGTTDFTYYHYHGDKDMGYARFIVRDASGAIVDDNMVAQGKFNNTPRDWPVTVPGGKDGEVWSITVELETEANAWDDFNLYFTGIPSRFAPTAEMVFLPDFNAPVQGVAERYWVTAYLSGPTYWWEFIPDETLGVHVSYLPDAFDTGSDQVWVDLVDPNGVLVIEDHPIIYQDSVFWEDNLYTFDRNDTPGFWKVITTARTKDGLPNSDMMTTEFVGAPPPVVNILTPPNGTEVNGSVIIEVDALKGHSRFNVTEVFLDINLSNGTITLSDDEAPWEFFWDSKFIKSIIKVNLSARAVDNIGTWGYSPNVTIIVNNTRQVEPEPTDWINLTVLSPLNGTEVQGIVNITTSIEGSVPPSYVTFDYNDTGIARVDPPDNYTTADYPWEPFTLWNTTGIANGEYLLHVLVFGQPEGILNETYITVFVNNTAPSPENVTLTISISPTYVKLKVNGTRQFNLTVLDQNSEPFSQDDLDQVRWLVSVDIGTITPRGLFTAVSPGNGTVTVQVIHGNQTLVAHADVEVESGDEPPPPPDDDIVDDDIVDDDDDDDEKKSLLWLWILLVVLAILIILAALGVFFFFRMGALEEEEETDDDEEGDETPTGEDGEGSVGEGEMEYDDDDFGDEEYLDEMGDEFEMDGFYHDEMEGFEEDDLLGEDDLDDESLFGEEEGDGDELPEQDVDEDEYSQYEQDSEEFDEDMEDDLDDEEPDLEEGVPDDEEMIVDLDELEDLEDFDDEEDPFDLDFEDEDDDFI